jgi:O-antigen/teichoic acid export membrane protein
MSREATSPAVPAATDAASAPTTVAAAPAPRSTLLRDALVTILTRFLLALLIFGTDIVLARLLGPAAKGRFTIVLLYSQLAALILGLGTDQALAVVSGRGREPAARGLANAIVWTAIVGGFGVVVSAWAYGLGHPGPPDGPLVPFLPNLSARQFVYAAVAIPGELFFAIGLNALLGRKRIVDYSVVRVLRRLVLLVVIIATAAVATLSLDVALVMNLLALALSGLAILLYAKRDGILSWRPSARLLGEELRFGLRAFPGAVAERLQFRADTFLVNGILGIRATGIYSVTSGLAETLWYIPNALGVVMFSRAVDPNADAGRVAAVLTRTTTAVALLTAIPTFILGPKLVQIVYGPAFADAGHALRLILPGIVAYSVVAILSRYIVGQGRPGTGTAIFLVGLAVNITANLWLIPRMGINGAAASSSISYALTALLTLAVFSRLSGRGWFETLVIRPSDIAALVRAARATFGRMRGRREDGGGRPGGPGSDSAAEMVIGEREPGEEP